MSAFEIPTLYVNQIDASVDDDRLRLTFNELFSVTEKFPRAVVTMTHANALKLRDLLTEILEANRRQH